MFRSFLSKWIEGRWIEGRLSKGRAGKVCLAQRATFRPCLEALEERTLLNAGAFDPTFGNGGMAIDPIAFSQQWVPGVQPDGKLLEASGDGGRRGSAE